MMHLVKLACVFYPVTTRGLQALAGVQKKGNSSSSRKAVWIQAGTRTGSSSILSMMSATPEDNRAGGDVFSLYEPCHMNDVFEYDVGVGKATGPWTWGPKTVGSVCGDIVSDVARCDFSKIVDLHGWWNPHTSNGHTTSFSREVAEKKCMESQFVAVKTVSEELVIEDAIRVLNENPDMKIIYVVRDPRGIFASKARAGVHTLTKRTDDFNLHSMDKLCEGYSSNLDFKHPRLLPVVFDDLVKDPLFTSQKVYKFLEMPWTEKQDEWVRTTFDNPDCDTGSTVTDRHLDCRSDSASAATKWEQELSSNVIKHFKENEDCVRVAKHYNFKL